MDRLQRCGVARGPGHLMTGARPRTHLSEQLGHRGTVGLQRAQRRDHGADVQPLALQIPCQHLQLGQSAAAGSTSQQSGVKYHTRRNIAISTYKIIKRDIMRKKYFGNTNGDWTCF